MYVLCLNPAIESFNSHDSSASLFESGKIIFAVEEERYTRQKHAKGTFPKNSIRECLSFEGISLSDVDQIVIPYKPQLVNRVFLTRFKRAVSRPDNTVDKLLSCEDELKRYAESKLFPDYSLKKIKSELQDIGSPLPDIKLEAHHKSHAASAFYPSGFDEAVIITVDGVGEYDSTVIWKGDRSGVTRHKTFKYPNSLGLFFGSITEFLGYSARNGEGKVMGLAPYGEKNSKIHELFMEVIDTTAEYDVRNITKNGYNEAVKRLETQFGVESKDDPANFTQWHKDFAHVAQSILENIMKCIVKKYTHKLGVSNVCLAGGVALNCKMNMIIEQLDAVDNLFVQPVANDAGLSLGGGMMQFSPSAVPKMNHLYFGPKYSDSVKSVLEERKLSYEKLENPMEEAARFLADGMIIGWIQERLEMGPRALGNRSILADPRSVDSKNKVNRYVKHREGWRPFAPSLKRESAGEYLRNPTNSPFMIKTYTVVEEKQKEIPAVLHPEDSTTRPQTVSEEQNPRYHELISEFENITDIPVLLNTSYNDHGEPIVNHPIEAVKDFYAMGLDALFIQDYKLEK
jgi:carbamoyltransferase